MKKLILLFLLIVVSLNAATMTWKVRDSDGDTVFVSSDGYIYHSGDTVYIDDALKGVSVLQVPYGDFSDSLYAKIMRGEFSDLDSAYIDTVTGYLKGDADSSIISDTAHYAEISLDSLTAEQWVIDTFIDSINTARLYANSILAGVSVSYNSIWLNTNFSLNFNSANDYLIYPFDNLADSIYVDSMNFQGYFNMTDAHDTLFWGIVEGHNYNYTPFVVDTIVIDSSVGGTMSFTYTTIIDSSWAGKNKGIQIFAHDISNYILFRGVYLWGKNYHKRYGIPE